LIEKSLSTTVSESQSNKNKCAFSRAPKLSRTIVQVESSELLLVRESTVIQPRVYHTCHIQQHSAGHQTHTAGMSELGQE